MYCKCTINNKLNTNQAIATNKCCAMVLKTQKMKTITYKCDCSECNNQTSNIENAKWLEIGSDNNTLFVNNYLENKHLISLQKYGSIHFCSFECLSKYFFEDSE